jgi:hypothetical protein
MSNNLGIFINSTNSDLKVVINLSNINKLKQNFHSIIIVDIENEFSLRLKELIDQKNVYKYLLNNKFPNSPFEDFNNEKIKYVLNNLEFIDFNNEFYVTFINDNYIYGDSLDNYFNYINIHNLDFYSMTDSTEGRYHYQLYLFTLKSTSVEKFKDYIKIYNHNIEYDIIKIFNKKMSYLKIAYIDINYENNIFYNSNSLYQSLVENNLLPIINLNKLENIKKNFRNTIFNIIPNNFDLETYKSHEDLKDLSDDKLYNHFLNYGQYEPRIYSKNNFIYPVYIRDLLKKCDLLKYYDVPDDFNLEKYNSFYSDLIGKNSKELLFHWVNYGSKENRIYK